jgi:hypothetical protein
MAKDIEQELDAILGHHQAVATQARSEAGRRGAAEESFDLAASTCLATVVMPALKQLVQALNERGVAARVVSSDGCSAQVDIPVSRHVRVGHGFGGYPYFRARADRATRRIYFERNTSGGIGSNAVANCEIAEVNGESIKAMVIDLVRHLYAPG